jgi:polyhydroxybutyrate depolymerase
MKPKILLILLLGSLLFTSCNKEEVPDMPPMQWQVGKNVFDMEVDGEDRNFLIHVPESYDGSEAVPVVFMLHGSSGNGEKFYNISGWVQMSEREGFIAVFPTALEYPIAENNGRLSTKWSAEGLEVDVVPGTEIKDDIPFFREMIQLCKESFAIDASRIYVSGFSNGGGFVKSRLLPQMSDEFAAFSTCGNIGIPIFIPMQDERIPPFQILSGTRDDRTIAAFGLMEELPLQAAELFAIPTAWAWTQNLLDMLSLDSSYSEMPMPPQYNQISFSNTLDDGSQELVYIVVNGLQHRYPNGSNNPHNVRAVELIWPWFTQFKLDL